MWLLLTIVYDLVHVTLLMLVTKFICDHCLHLIAAVKPMFLLNLLVLYQCFYTSKYLPGVCRYSYTIYVKEQQNIRIWMVGAFRGNPLFCLICLHSLVCRFAFINLTPVTLFHVRLNWVAFCLRVTNSLKVQDHVWNACLLEIKTNI